MNLITSLRSLMALCFGLCSLQLSGQTAKVLTTTADRSLSLAETTLKPGKATKHNTNVIRLDPGKTFQQMDGFGFAITYSSCYNLLKMSPEARHKLLVKTYSRTEGYGVSYARMSIGCNDFSSTEYSLCDEKGLENFRFYSDEVNYVFPVLREILAINPDLKIIAAPWTSPKWMKVEDLSSMKPHDSWVDGHLNPVYYDEYARYFVKFIEGMQQEGFKVYAVSPQNEPLNHGNSSSLYMPWQEQAPFVKVLAKAFKAHGLATKIYLFDHNYNYDNVPDQTDYPVRIYEQLGNTFEGSEYIVGAAYHNYGGSKDELTDIYRQASDKELVFTETSIGTWNDGRNLGKRLLDDMREVALGTINQMCKAVLVWNLMLDSQRGPNLDGGCQTCYGAIDIDKETYTKLTFNSHYYIISHLAAVIAPGAYRIEAKGACPKGIVYSAFRNPDGSLAFVVMNESGRNEVLRLQNEGRELAVKVPARSVVSVKWKVGK